MRILFIVKRYYSGQDLLSGFGRYGHFPIELEKRGHQIHTIALDQRRGPASPEGGSIQSLPPVAFFRSAEQLARDFQPDMIIGGGHLYMGSLGMRIARRIGCPFIFDIYDFYPSFLKRFAFMGNPWFTRLLRRADGISAASPALGEFAARFNSRTCVARNATDPPSGARLGRAVARDLFGLPQDAFIAGYVGGLAEYVMIEECLDALDSLENILPSPLIAQIGSHSRIFAPHPRMCMLGNQPRERVSRFIEACDLLLAPYRNCENRKYFNACKLSEYAVGDAVVVASRNGDWASYLPDDYPGLFNPEEPKTLRAALEMQYHKKQQAPSSPLCFWSASTATIEKLVENIAKESQKLGDHRRDQT